MADHPSIPFNYSRCAYWLISIIYLIARCEVHVNENLPAKYFVGLGVDQQAPGHATLTVFRGRLTKHGNLEIFELLLAEIVQIAMASGIQFGSIQVIDSVHRVANVNTAKDLRCRSWL